MKLNNSLKFFLFITLLSVGVLTSAFNTGTLQNYNGGTLSYSSGGSATCSTYATWNSSDKDPDVTLSNGDLTETTAAGTNGSVRSTISVASGKYSWELTVGAFTDFNQMYSGVGNASMNIADAPGLADANGLGWSGQTGGIYKNNSLVSSGAGYTTGDVLRFEVDRDAGTVQFFKNNVSRYTASGGNVPTGALFAAVGVGGYTTSSTANFGATAFVNTPTAGFTAGLCN